MYIIPIFVVTTLIVFGIYTFFNKKTRKVSMLPEIAESDLRVYKRLQIKKSTRLFVRFKNESNLHDAWVCDYSQGGLCILISTKESNVHPGTILKIKAANHLDNPWITIEIRYCQKTPGGYQIGCMFIDKPLTHIFRSFTGR